jgi:hypothetical protein
VSNSNTSRVTQTLTSNNVIGGSTLLTTTTGSYTTGWTWTDGGFNSGGALVSAEFKPAVVTATIPNKGYLVQQTVKRGVYY